MTTNNGWSHYVWEQLGHVQRGLISRGSLEERLIWIASTRLPFILSSADEVPEQHRPSIEAIRVRFSQRTPAGTSEGALPAAITAMNEDEREAVALELHDLWYRCQLSFEEASKGREPNG